jgi:hypothetical protein
VLASTREYYDLESVTPYGLRSFSVEHATKNLSVELTDQDPSRVGH